MQSYCHYMERIVPDSKSRNIPEVVIVRRWAAGVLGIWRGWDSWVKGGQIGSVYKQPETEVDDSCHSWRVPSKWKGTQRGGKGEPARGARGVAPCIYVTVLYVQRMIERLKNASYRVHNNNQNECC
jgi:hypothetical protein